MIRPPDLPPVVDAAYPSRPDTVSNAPLPLDSVEQDAVSEDTECTNARLHRKRSAATSSVASSPKKTQKAAQVLPNGTLPGTLARKRHPQQKTCVIIISGASALTSV